MKSIIQEASSIAKAIEHGWLKAGKPQDFSVKVFQESEKNFIGMTTKQAKIAIIFNDHVAAAALPRVTKQARQAPEPRTATKKLQKSPVTTETNETRNSDYREGNALRAQKPSREPRTRLEKGTPEREQLGTPTPVWTGELDKAAQEWLRESLTLLGYPKVVFSTSIHQQLLKINFSSPLMEDATKQKYLFRNLAFLLMQTLRHQAKRSLRHARIIFTCNETAA
jgi:hypothetical protein